MILFYDFSVLKDESYKKSNVFCHCQNNIGFYKECTTYNYLSVLRCNRCKIHRYVAAPLQQVLDIPV
jgi:hypothetical protein